MKKAIKVLFALLLMLLPISGTLAGEEKKKPEIKTVDNYVAIFDFEVTTGDKGISRPLADSVIHEFSQSKKYEVIDRGNMNKILKEQKFQMSGCVAQECKVEAGQILGVGKIVNGSVGLVGKTYYLTLQLIDVQTGKIELSVVDKCKCELDELIDSTTRLAKKLLGEKVEQPVTTALKPTFVVESKAKAEAEEIEKAKAEQITKDKAEAEETVRAKAKAEATARAEEIEREKAAQVAKAEAITKPAEPEQKITNSIGMTFVYIRPGTFMMGSPSGELGRDNDETQHQVILTKGFYMQTTEVTQGQWQAVMGNNPSHFKNCGDDCPVEQVSWNDVQEFIQRLNLREGGGSYRLPTEAEWEYSCRAGTNTRYSFGDSDNQLRYYAWYGSHFFGKIHPVGQKQPNDWGLYDMHGNVLEWCQDWYGYYPAGNITDPAGHSSGSFLVNRGGSWLDHAGQCRSASRNYSTRDGRDNDLGFRLYRTP